MWKGVGMEGVEVWNMWRDEHTLWFVNVESLVDGFH